MASNVQRDVGYGMIGVGSIVALIFLGRAGYFYATRNNCADCSKQSAKNDCSACKSTSK